MGCYFLLQGVFLTQGWNLYLLHLLYWQADSLPLDHQVSPLHSIFMRVKVKSLSRVRLFVTTWTVAYQAPPSMEFSRQEYWSGLPFPSPGDLPDPGIELMSLIHCIGRQILYQLSHWGKQCENPCHV